MGKARPDGTTMEGMIWNANHVLDAALDPETMGIPKSLFQDARGIVLISIVEVGFIFSGNVGTGVILVKDDDENKWSAPSAIGLGGVGWGFLVGGAFKDVMIFLMDDGTVNTYTGNVQVKLGGQANLTVGPWGRDASFSLDFSNKGFGGVVAVAFSRGAFICAAVEGAWLGPRSAANAHFYGKELTPSQILFEGMGEYPEDSLVPELHKKLELLAEGKTSVPTEEEKEKVDAAKEQAVKAGEEAKSKHDDIEYVDAGKEAEKESCKEEVDADKKAATESGVEVAKSESQQDTT